MRAVMTRPRDPAKLVVDVADMRDRMEQQTVTDRIWDVKHISGGLVDAEFIAQYLQLRHAADHPGVLRTNTTEALAALAEARALDRARAEALIDAVRLWRRIQGMLRLTVGRLFEEAALPDALRASLAQAGRAPDFSALKEKMHLAASLVRAAFDDIVVAPAREAGWTPRRSANERSPQQRA
jgi:glutamate-ammonia-ligase adenylyltransferase